MLLMCQILFGVFPTHLILFKPYNNHFWVKKIMFMNTFAKCCVCSGEVEFEPRTIFLWILSSNLASISSSRRKYSD